MAFRNRFLNTCFFPDACELVFKRSNSTSQNWCPYSIVGCDLTQLFLISVGTYDNLLSDKFHREIIITAVLKIKTGWWVWKEKGRRPDWHLHSTRRDSQGDGVIPPPVYCSRQGSRPPFVDGWPFVTFVTLSGVRKPVTWCLLSHHVFSHSRPTFMPKAAKNQPVLQKTACPMKQLRGQQLPRCFDCVRHNDECRFQRASH